jgi:hypothetical protein
MPLWLHPYIILLSSYSFSSFFVCLSRFELLFSELTQKTLLTHALYFKEGVLTFFFFMIYSLIGSDSIQSGSHSFISGNSDDSSFSPL